MFNCASLLVTLLSIVFVTKHVNDPASDSRSARSMYRVLELPTWREYRRVVFDNGLPEIKHICLHLGNQQRSRRFAMNFLMQTTADRRGKENRINRINLPFNSQWILTHRWLLLISHSNVVFFSEITSTDVGFTVKCKSESDLTGIKLDNIPGKEDNSLWKCIYKQR